MYDIPCLDAARLASTIPLTTWHRYGRFDPTDTLFIFRAGRYDARAIGGTLGFYVDDFRLEALWTKRAHYRTVIARQQWASVIMPDFSLWTDMPIAEQIWNVYRARKLACEWQAEGVLIAPNLSWSDERSFGFCFEGIPPGCPVAFCQARTVRTGDRTAFLKGLRRAVKALKPAHVVIYGKAEWLPDKALPKGPTYSRLGTVIDGMRQARFGSPVDPGAQSIEIVDSRN